MPNNTIPQIKQLYKNGNNIIRILAINDNMICIIDCTKYTMPVWKPIEILNHYTTYQTEGADKEPY